MTDEGNCLDFLVNDYLQPLVRDSGQVEVPGH